ncbi:MAG TPA: polysaccharide deacetylase family protein [Gemmatimonadaceae bacterium]|nr:polysaccharide deacetylase family protein [Gemmatimonadaceae bacterium]
MRAILTYHSLDDSGSPVSIAPDVFRQHVRWLAAGPVRVVALTTLLHDDEPGDAVAITFDDAFANFATLGAPVLREHGMRATIFAVSDHVGGTNAWNGLHDERVPTLPLCDWDSLGALSASGFEIASHTRRHADLSTLDVAAIEDEIGGSCERIRGELGVAVSSFCYPYGGVNAGVADVARRHVALAVTTELRTLGARDDVHLLPRIDMYYLRDAGRLEAWGSAAFRRRLWLRGRARGLRALMARGNGRA